MTQYSLGRPCVCLGAVLLTVMLLAPLTNKRGASQRSPLTKPAKQPHIADNDDQAVPFPR